MQYAHGFVEYADTAMLSHKEILASRILRSQPGSIGEPRKTESRFAQMGFEMENTGGANKPRTMAEKVWADHVVSSGEGSEQSNAPDLIYIDLHLVHEVTSPQAFDLSLIHI